MQKASSIKYCTWANASPIILWWCPICISVHFNHCMFNWSVIMKHSSLLPFEVEAQTNILVASQIQDQVLQHLPTMLSCWRHLSCQETNAVLTVWQICCQVQQNAYCTSILWHIWITQQCSVVLIVDGRMWGSLLRIRLWVYSHNFLQLSNVLMMGFDKHQLVTQQNMPTLQKSKLFTQLSHDAVRNLVCTLQSRNETFLHHINMPCHQEIINMQ